MRFVPSRVPRPALLAAAAAVLGLVGWLSSGLWMPAARNVWAAIADPPAGPKLHDHGDHDDHAGHDHGAHAADSVTLSSQARRNIGLKTGKVTVGEYVRTVAIPAMVVERPGRTELRVVTPLTGIVTDVFAVPGQAVEAGKLLFILRLNRDEIVQAQIAFLGTIEALDVENREIRRLEAIKSGVVAEKVVLERRYERQKIEARLKAEREALLLLGLTTEEVNGIAADRTLLREYRLYVPAPHDEGEAGHLEQAHPTAHEASAGREAVSTSADPGSPSPAERPLLVTDLAVHKGESANAGAVLCTLADLNELYVEGRAFEQDAAALAEAVRRGWTVTAVPDQPGATPIEGLEIAYVANAIDPETRTLPFYVRLPNEVAGETRERDRRFVAWRYKPGQRMELRVPVETWTDRVVLPTAAVADEGAESYVFVEKGRRFERRPVHVEHRGGESVVIAKESLPAGLTVALTGAHQLQMALKSAAGGVDLHAGHMH